MEFTLHHFPTLASTNTTAREWASAGAAEGTVIVADCQTAGRGRQGRAWNSLPGALLLSLVLRPRFSPSLLPLLGFYACVSAATAAEAQGVPRAWLKWPNDLVLPLEPSRAVTAAEQPPEFWAKWGGVLVETGNSSQHGPWAVVGIGLNLAPIDDDTRQRLACTSLSQGLSAAVERESFLHSLLQELDVRYHPGAGVQEGTLDEWRKRDVLRGRAVRATTPGHTIEGIAGGINDRGALAIHSPDGCHWIDAGDVHLTGIQ